MLCLHSPVSVDLHVLQAGLTSHRPTYHTLLSDNHSRSTAWWNVHRYCEVTKRILPCPALPLRRCLLDVYAVRGLTRVFFKQCKVGRFGFIRVDTGVSTMGCTGEGEDADMGTYVHNNHVVPGHVLQAILIPEEVLGEYGETGVASFGGRSHAYFLTGSQFYRHFLGRFRPQNTEDITPALEVL